MYQNKWKISTKLHIRRKIVISKVQILFIKSNCELFFKVFHFPDIFAASEYGNVHGKILDDKDINFLHCVSKKYNMVLHFYFPCEFHQLSLYIKVRISGKIATASEAIKLLYTVN